MSVHRNKNFIPGGNRPKSVLRVRNSDNTAHDVTSHRFLGIVLSHKEFKGETALQLRLLYHWEGKWIHYTAETVALWRNAPENVRNGTLWALEVQRTNVRDLSISDNMCTLTDLVNKKVESDDPSIDQSEEMLWLVHTEVLMPVYVYEIIKHDGYNYSHNKMRLDKLAVYVPLEEVEAVRQSYIVHGTEIPPLGPILVEFKDECVIGPLDLHCDEYGKWRALPQIVAVRKPLPRQSFHTLDMEYGKRKIRVATEGLPDHIMDLDFRSDMDTFGSIIDKVFDVNSNGIHNQTHRELAHQLLLEIQALPRPIMELADKYTAYRFENALKRIEDTQESKERWRMVVLSMPETKAIVETAVSTLRESGHTLKELQQSCREQQDLLDNLKMRTQLANSELSDAIDNRISIIASKVVGEVAGRIVAKLPDPQIVVTPVPPHTSEISRASVELAPTIMLWKKPLGPDSIPTISEVIQRLKKQLSCNGFSEMIAAPLIAAWLADLVPIIAGGDALRFLRYASQCFAGERFLVSHATSDIVSVSDLFGHVHSARRIFTPAPTGLADILIAANQGEFRDVMGVIAFANVNLADVASAFLPLIEAFRGASVGKSEAMLPIIHPSSLTAGDPYEPLCRAYWPQNLLPAFTLATGATSMPPPIFWEAGVLIVANLTEDKVHQTRCLEIDPRAWKGGRSAARDHMQNLKATPDGNARDRRFVGGLLACGVAQDEAHRITYLGRRLPVLLSSGRDAKNDDIPQGIEQRAIEDIRRMLFHGGI